MKNVISEARYKANYNRIAHDDIAHSIMPAWYTEAQAARAIRYAGPLDNKSVLDVGAGKGILLNKIKHNNKVAVDIAPEYLELLKARGIETVEANAENMPFENRFDVVFATDILEHVLDPAAVLESIYRALKPGGITVIRVPYKEDISIYKSSVYDFVHLRSFDTGKLKAMLIVAGFKNIKIKYDGFDFQRLKGRLLRIIVFNLIRLRPSMLGVAQRLFVYSPSWFGKLFMPALEIAAVARKMKEELNHD